MDASKLNEYLPLVTIFIGGIGMGVVATYPIAFMAGFRRGTKDHKVVVEEMERQIAAAVADGPGSPDPHVGGWQDAVL